MRSATWETSAGALAAFLDTSTQTFMADLYTITLSGGSVLRYTSADIAAVVNGTTFAIGPAIKRGNTNTTVGVSVDSLEVTIAADNTVQVGTTPLLKFIAGGGLDGATILVERAFSSGPGAAWVGTLGMFKGRVSDIQTSRYEALLTVNSDSELLNVMIPRNVYQAGCANTLYDPACGLIKGSYSVATAATSATDATQTTFNIVQTYASNYFDLGFAVCTSGANAGLSRTIKTYIGTGHTPQSVQTIQPWPSPVAIGDAFTLYPGCDKTKATCSSKFSNLVKFRGFPFIPAPESVT